MGTYANSSDVAARVPYRKIDATSDPTDVQVEQWITAAEAKLTGVLAAGQATTPVINANGIEIVKSWVTDYAEGRVRMAYAATGDGSNDDGKDLVEGFENLLTAIRADTAGFDAELSGGTSTDSSRTMRGHVLDNSDGKTIAAGDFAPTFTTEEVF